MAAPTSPYVESTSISTATLYWTYGGSAAIAVYRAPYGGAYAEITGTQTLVRPSATSGTFVDTTVAVATRYQYKLSDDVGSTFSAVVDVVTQSCPQPQGTSIELILPRFSDEVNQTIELNNMAERIESILQGRVLNSEECIVCVTNGAVVIDCTDGCQNFVVIADENINSISINGCNNEDLVVEMVIPPNVTRQISGWPAGFGFSGDEARQMPIVTGSTGAKFSVGRSAKKGGGFAMGSSNYNPSSGSGSKKNGTTTGGPSGGATGGGSGGAGGCQCTPVNGGLTIKCCDSYSKCSLGCSNTVDGSNTKQIMLIACGGRGPYAWTKTGNNKFKGRGVESTDTTTETDDVVIMRPPANTGSGEAGTAYYRTIQATGCGHTLGTDHAGALTLGAFGCSDAFIGTVIDAATNINCGWIDPTCGCNEHLGHTDTPGICSGNVECSFECAAGTETQCMKDHGAVDDKRTAGMISAGCNPCAVNAQAATVTVTDANGVAVTKILKA